MKYNSLLDGLEAVELKLSDVLANNITFRFDSQYFKKELISFYKKITNFEKLGSFVESGYRVVYENTKILDIALEEQKKYTRFLQASDLLTPEIVLDNVGFVHNVDWHRYEKGRIEKGELLIEVKGKAEKVAIVYDDIPEKILVSGSLFKLKVNNEITKEYLLTFLLCKYGEMFKDRSKTNLLIAYISKPDLYNIPVPIVSKDFQLKITNFINLSHQKLKESKLFYKQSENLLLKELDLLDFELSKEEIAIKSFSKSFGDSGRLDSEYYQPKYDDIVDKVKSYKGGFEFLNIVCNLKDKNYKPQDKEYYQYIELSNIGTTGDITGFTYEQGQNLPSRARRLINENDVIISSIEGSLEKIAIVRKEFNNSLCSTGFYVINSNKINSETLLVLFKNKIMQQILKQKCSGTILTGMNKDDFLDIIIPNIDNTIQIQIEEKIKKSFKLKEESKQLLEVAKRAVEIAIEKNEDIAIEFIDENRY